MRGIVIAMAVLAGPAQAFDDERTPPAAGCLDARRMVEMRQPAPGALAVMDAAGQRFRIDLGVDCPEAGDAGAQLLARDGWVCGHGQEYVRAGATLCPVAGLVAVDAREYATLSRAADQRDEEIRTLAPVEVREARRRGFAGSANYCFNPRYLRAWAEDPQGLLVELSPRRSGGHRFYRVELANSCPDLDSAPAIVFRSGFGIGVICGNPGDQIVSVDGSGAGGPVAGSGAGFRCAVAAVYPHEPEGASAR
ncbi:hypothetical protein [Pseudoxanthomonas sp. 10H]|uniref:hypothetical protein n=1 Tax=Pseudoxanthomonas sp. 10H TaxID=3242729 RepID=UPI003556B1E0